MSSKEITELRKAGKLDEALEMANMALETDPENIWNKRVASWVYYDYLKKYAHPDSFDTFKEKLIKIRDLQLPDDEKMVFDNSAWQIGKIVFALQKQEYVDYGKINQIFDIIKDFHFTTPSDGYSFLHKAFIKGYKSWSRYIEFADWWGLENIRDTDYEKEMFNGRENMSLAEKIYIAYPKHLLEGETTDSFAASKKLDIEKIKKFIPKLEEVIQNHPDYKYAIYYKTKLLLAISQKEEALESFIPFLKIKKNDSWVWKLLGDIYSDDIDMQISCYCKALSLKTQEDFLIKLRESLADLLIQKGLFPEAKTEIEKAIRTRESHDEWKLTNNLKRWKNSDWYSTNRVNENNTQFYKENLTRAEEVIYNDIPEEIVVVEYVNTDKKILNFIKNKQKSGFFKYAPQLSEEPRVGDILKVRLQEKGDEGFFEVITVKKANKENSEAIKNFEGSLKKIMGKGFGFINDVFIDEKTIKDFNLLDSNFYKGKAIISFNKKKEEWGWKVLEIKIL